MKKAVHFGGGNIGRGFIGEILHDNDFSITFIDVNESMIDALNQDNGYTIEIGDIKALAEKINTLLDDKDKIKTMGKNLFKDVKENFSSEPMAKRHVEIYNEILNNVEEK